PPLRPQTSTLLPYTTLFRSELWVCACVAATARPSNVAISNIGVFIMFNPKTMGDCDYSVPYKIFACRFSDGRNELEMATANALKDRKSTRLNSSHRTISYAV